MSSNISGLDWELPGNINLSQARFSISYSEEDERVSAGIGEDFLHLAAKMTLIFRRI